MLKVGYRVKKDKLVKEICQGCGHDTWSTELYICKTPDTGEQILLCKDCEEANDTSFIRYLKLKGTI